MLFGSQIPIGEDFGTFSLAWAGHVPGESLLQGLDQMAKSKDLPEFYQGIKSIGTYLSVPQNLVLADTSGNIGYMLLSSSPKRGNEYPYLGCRVLDGTSSQHDWEGIVGVDHLPMVMNPSKGYYMTANNRIVPEKSKFDIGGTMISTGRALRIKEVLEKGIKEGKKFDAQDMIDLQQDMTDVIARDLKPHIVKIVERALKSDKWKFEQQSSIEHMLDLFRDFDGQMSENSISTSIYSYWQYFFY